MVLVIVVSNIPLLGIERLRAVVYKAVVECSLEDDARVLGCNLGQ